MQPQNPLRQPSLLSDLEGVANIPQQEPPVQQPIQPTQTPPQQSLATPTDQNADLIPDELTDELQQLKQRAMLYTNENDYLSSIGYPLYHTTGAQFEQFDPQFLGSNTGDVAANTQQGFFFSPSLMDIASFKTKLEQGIENFAGEKLEPKDVSGYRTIEKVGPRGKFLNLKYDDVINNRVSTQDVRDILEFTGLKGTENQQLLYENNHITPAEYLSNIVEEMNPLDWEEIVADPDLLKNYLTSKGYEGFIYDFGGNKSEYVVFDPNRLKGPEEYKKIFQETVKERNDNLDILADTDTSMLMPGDNRAWKKVGELITPDQKLDIEYWPTNVGTSENPQIVKNYLVMGKYGKRQTFDTQELNNTLYINNVGSMYADDSPEILKPLLEKIVEDARKKGLEKIKLKDIPFESEKAEQRENIYKELGFATYGDGSVEMSLMPSEQETFDLGQNLLRGSKKYTEADIKETQPDIQLAKDLTIKDTSGNVVNLEKGEKLTPHMMKDGRVVIQDGVASTISPTTLSDIDKASYSSDPSKASSFIKESNRNVKRYDADTINDEVLEDYKNELERQGVDAEWDGYSWTFQFTKDALDEADETEWSWKDKDGDFITTKYEDEAQEARDEGYDVEEYTVNLLRDEYPSAVTGTRDYNDFPDWIRDNWPDEPYVDEEGMKYENYTLAGDSEDYREIVVSLPFGENMWYKTEQKMRNDLIKKYKLERMPSIGSDYKSNGFKSAEQSSKYWNEVAQIENKLEEQLGQDKSFTGSHHNDADVEYHLRLTDRYLPIEDGENVYATVAEELQSDWEKKLRTWGAWTPEDSKNYKKAIKIQDKVNDLNNIIRENWEIKDDAVDKLKNILVSEFGFSENRTLAKDMYTEVLKRKELQTPDTKKLVQVLLNAEKKINNVSKRRDMLNEQYQNLSSTYNRKTLYNENLKNWRDNAARRLLYEWIVNTDNKYLVLTTGEQQQARYNIFNKVKQFELDNFENLPAYKDQILNNLNTNNLTAQALKRIKPEEIFNANPKNTFIIDLDSEQGKFKLLVDKKTNKVLGSPDNLRASELTIGMPLEDVVGDEMAKKLQRGRIGSIYDGENTDIGSKALLNLYQNIFPKEIEKLVKSQFEYKDLGLPLYSKDSNENNTIAYHSIPNDLVNSDTINKIRLGRYAKKLKILPETSYDYNTEVRDFIRQNKVTYDNLKPNTIVKLTNFDDLESGGYLDSRAPKATTPYFVLKKDDKNVYLYPLDNIDYAGLRDNSFAQYDKFGYSYKDLAQYGHLSPTQIKKYILNNEKFMANKNIELMRSNGAKLTPKEKKERRDLFERNKIGSIKGSSALMSIPTMVFKPQLQPVLKRTPVIEAIVKGLAPKIRASGRKF